MTSAGDMRDRFRFEARSTAADEYGNPVTGDWVGQFVRAVEVKPMRGGEGVLAARLGGTQPILIRARFDTQTALISTDWRAVDTRTGTVYQIRSAADMSRKRQFIEMMAEAGVGS